MDAVTETRNKGLRQGGCYAALRTILVVTAMAVGLVGCATGSSVTGPDGERHAAAGEASWYGEQFHGNQTASGEVYNMHQHTAAHRTLPFGTRVRVQRADNGKSVVVRINDRGPFVRGRVIDLSYAAARQIGMIHDGVAPVQLEVVDW